jgi:two-component system cell cycle sensor histidine kinase/response regulator CckA
MDCDDTIAPASVPLAKPTVREGNSAIGLALRSRILLVDDDPAQLKLGRLHLLEAGFSVETAAGVDEAILKAKATQVDAILCDVVMEPFDGFTLCRRLREQPELASVPVVLASAHYDVQSDEPLALHVGASALVLRTSDFVSEIRALRSSLQRGAGHAQPQFDNGMLQVHLQKGAQELAKLVTRARRADVRYRSLFESAIDAISVLTPEGIIVEANRRWQDVLMIPPEQLIGRHVRDLSARGHENDNTARFLKSVEEGGGRDEAVPLKRADGVTVYMEFSTNVVQLDGGPLVFCIGRDVTERVLSARALEAAEEKYRSLVERMPEAVWTADGELRITYISPNVVNVCGSTAQEFCAEDLAARLARIHPEDLELARRAFEGLVKDGKPFDIEYRRMRKDGVWGWIRNRAIVTFDRDGKRGAEGLISDVTDRRQLEEQLRHAQKMEAIGTLAGGIAHDFNNMLNVLLGYTMMLLEGMPSHHPMHEALSEMKRAGERSADLTHQLLAFSRQKPPVVQVVDLNESIVSVEKLARRLVGEDIAIVTRLSPERCKVSADLGQIEQVIMNLTVNSRDAMPAGGTLTFETAVETLGVGSAEPLGEVKPGCYAMLGVTDTGVGMNGETQARIFEPFFTTKEFGKGTGLGLSIVFGIVRQSGGHIRVHSEPNRGTSFRVYLPIALDDAKPAVQRRSTRSESIADETILLVEDEEQVRKFAASVLRKAGYDVLVARDPNEALLIYETHGHEINLLLTDVIMPQLNGWELAKQILKSHPKMKIIYMSGYTDTVSFDRAESPGVAFLQKPISPNALRGKVRAVLDSSSGES